MLGEFCREAAVLVFVFSNLDLWLYHQASNWEVVKHVLQSIAVTFIFLAAGIVMERWQKP